MNSSHSLQKLSHDIIECIKAHPTYKNHQGLLYLRHMYIHPRADFYDCQFIPADQVNGALNNTLDLNSASLPAWKLVEYSSEPNLDLLRYCFQQDTVSYRCRECLDDLSYPDEITLYKITDQTLHTLSFIELAQVFNCLMSHGQSFLLSVKSTI